MLARVSNIEAFRQWKSDEEASVESLVAFLTVDAPTPAMRAGTAFHEAMELSEYGHHDVLYAQGYTFQLPDAELVIPRIREVRAYKQYGELTVTGKLDCLDGNRVDDHKTTGRIDFERYLTGYSWRFYLDIFEADLFRWNVFEIRELEPMVYEVSDPQLLEISRYPGMHEDCAQLAAEYLEFARVHLPDGATIEDR